MTDERLRTLERAAFIGGIEERAALLRARMRSGDLERGRVELAAYCGDEAAWRVAPCQGWFEKNTDGTVEHYPIASWLAGIPKLTTWETGRSARDSGICAICGSRGGCACPQCVVCRRRDCTLGAGEHQTAEREVMVRCAVAAGWVALKAFHNQQDGRPCYGVPRRVLEAAEAWLACPCEEHMRLWRDACAGLSGGRFGVEWVVVPNRRYHAKGIEAAVRATSESTIRAAIQAALIAWALDTDQEAA